MIESLWNLQNKSLALAKHTNRQIFPSSTRQQHRDSITQFGLLLLRQRMSPLQNELKKKKKAVVKVVGIPMFCFQDCCLDKQHQEIVWKGYRSLRRKKKAQSLEGSALNVEQQKTTVRMNCFHNTCTSTSHQL